MKYVAVGFRCDKSRSIFYIKSEDYRVFSAKLETAIHKKDPDFVSLRMVREQKP